MAAKRKTKNVGILEYGLVITLVIIVAMSIISLVFNDSSNAGTLICPDRTYHGRVWTTYDEIYRIELEDGREMLVSKQECRYISD